MSTGNRLESTRLFESEALAMTENEHFLLRGNGYQIVYLTLDNRLHLLVFAGKDGFRNMTGENPFPMLRKSCWVLRYEGGLNRTNDFMRIEPHVNIHMVNAAGSAGTMSSWLRYCLKIVKPSLNILGGISN